MTTVWLGEGGVVKSWNLLWQSRWLFPYDFDKYITTFVPFIIEDFGALHNEAKQIWDKLCEMAAARTNTSRSQYRLFQSKLFSSNIVQCNTNRIARKYDLGTIPVMD